MAEWIVRPQVRPTARQRLFCFPYAGVGASAFRGWGQSFGPGVEISCIQLPGREGRLRERPANSIKELIPPLVAALQELLDLPYAFYGHSFGARIAFEVLRELRRIRAPQPFHLFVGAAAAPHVPSARPPIRDLPQQDFLDRIQQRYGGIPAQILEDADMLALLLPALRADLTAMETYTYEHEAALACPITAIGGTADRAVNREDLARWEDHTERGCLVQLLNGGHFFLQSNKPQLLSLISASFDTAGVALAGRQSAALPSVIFPASE